MYVIRYLANQVGVIERTFEVSISEDPISFKADPRARHERLNKHIRLNITTAVSNLISTNNGYPCSAW